MTKNKLSRRSSNGRKSPHNPLRSYQILLPAMAIGCFLGADVAAAAGLAGEVPHNDFPLAKVATFLFLMLGPFKIIGPFAKLTKHADPQLTKRLALLSILFASMALLIAALLGKEILSSYGIPVSILALSAGIILFLVALINILQQFLPSGTHTEEDTPAPTINMALMPLAFPIIVTPYGIATLVVFLALSPNWQSQLIVGAVVLAIMLMNLSIMLVTKKIPPFVGVLLAIIGAVLGVVQVALGVSIIVSSLHAIGSI